MHLKYFFLNKGYHEKAIMTIIQIKFYSVMMNNKHGWNVSLLMRVLSNTSIVYYYY